MAFIDEVQTTPLGQDSTFKETPSSNRRRTKDQVAIDEALYNRLLKYREDVNPLPLDTRPTILIQHRCRFVLKKSSRLDKYLPIISCSNLHAKHAKTLSIIWMIFLVG
jgi:hypothetical protein